VQLNPIHEQFVELICAWGREHLREFPWRSSESPLEILVAEVLLQRTPAQRVEERFIQFRDRVLSVGASHLRDQTKREFRDLGLGKRIDWLLDSLQIIEKEYSGRVPDSVEDLLLLPGVGRYTANAVLCLAYGKPVPLVDANVIRILTRVFGLSVQKQSRPESEVVALAASLVPHDYARLYNLSMVDHGALICRKKPLCTQCPLVHLCDYYRRCRPADG